MFSRSLSQISLPISFANGLLVGLPNGSPIGFRIGYPNGSLDGLRIGLPIGFVDGFLGVLNGSKGGYSVLYTKLFQEGDTGQLNTNFILPFSPYFIRITISYIVLCIT